MRPYNVCRFMGVRLCQKGPRAHEDQIDASTSHAQRGALAKYKYKV